MQSIADQEAFDEDAYLRHNPDVARAVAAGQFTSGLDHFTRFGRFEQRSGAPGQVGSVFIQDASFPFPPEHLRMRVHGARDLESYLRLGKTITHDLINALADDALQIPQAASVLDFGSGPGRVIGWFHQQYPEWKFFGTDIDDEAIGWAREHLSAIAEFGVNGYLPPLNYADGTFDLVYSISIFTHLPEEMQTDWLAELARVTKPGGSLLLSTHAEHLLNEYRHFMPERGFYYSVGDGTNGLPDFYQTSFQTNAYIEREWSRHFNIKEIRPRGIANHQDLVICAKAR
jgi:SAM-dependent methyltransferase